ncbi:NAD-dependent epimerase/dehydratase family protein [Candidatus Beckwithbacteria bacterium]|nr:NAD-dependent epimerase/dehydratase family protein [Candidatus Beckwithbacteria bacterium]
MNMDQKSILITGGAGLIGSHLCDLLLNQGHRVTCVDNFITGRKENLEIASASPNFKCIEADISNPAETYLDPNFHFDYMYHLASPASPKGYHNNPIATYKANAFGTHYLLEYARKINARFLYSSTSESYGDPLEHPQKESYWGNVNPVGIRACYDVSKRFGEMACITAFREFGQDVRIVRIFNTFGPRNDPNDGRVIPTFILQALKNEPITIFGDGSHTRSYCYVADLIRGLESFMTKPDLAGEIINLGNPREFTVLETAQIIKKLTKSSSEISNKPLEGVREEDPKKRQPDITKAKTLLNWQPEISFEQGLEPTIVYYQKTL